MEESIEYKNIKTLQKLKLIDTDDSFLDPKFLSEKIDERLLSKTLEKLIQNESLNIEKDFNSTAISLLGYELNIDYDKDEEISFAKSIGLSPKKNTEYTNSDFFNDMIFILRAKTKDGMDYFERLCIEGVFKDYNKDKKVPEILIFNGKTQPIFDYNESIFEKMYVETPLDTDKDNKRDLIEVYIRRPKETNKGMKVPVIYIANPYMLASNDDLYKPHNVDCELEISDETNIKHEDIRYIKTNRELPEPRVILGSGKAQMINDKDVELECITPWYNYFLVRGYALVFAGGIGTRGSQGVRTCGSVEETISTISVIDWLNNRVKGFSNKTDNFEVTANWCNGNVGMTGKSYIGTLTIAAATTGVEGLKTIVPQAAISNWYDYYRCNGLNVPALGWQGDDADLLAEYCFSRVFDPEDYKDVKDCFDNVLDGLKKDEDRIFGNYNKFWDERNYLNNADKIKASVFIEHGLRDWNVKSKQFDMLWRELEKYDIPRKMVLHQGDHIYINNLKGIDFNDIMNKWYGYWLYDIDNHIMEDLPTVIIQNNADITKWDETKSWPFDGVENVKFYINDNNKLTKTKEDYDKKSTFIDDLSLTGFDRLKADDTTKWLESIINQPEIEKPYRLAYTSDVLSKNHRISGTITFEMNASLDSKTGIVSAMLVDYGIKNRPSLERKVVKKEAFIYGKNAGTDDLVDFKIDAKSSDFAVISRGWLNAQNRRNNYNKDEVIINKNYTFTFDMQPTDYTILKGHKLGLIIYSTDAEATQRPSKITEFTVCLDSVNVTIPMK